MSARGCASRAQSAALDSFERLGINPAEDFHALNHAAVERLLGEADRVGYRQPRGANGSRARYFHARLIRAAAK